MNKQELYQKLIDKYGEKQDLILIEEMAELTKEIIKEKRGKQNIDNLKEEVIDVLIMIEQKIKMLNMSEDEVKKLMEKKLKRTYERLNNEKSKNENCKTN